MKIRVTKKIAFGNGCKGDTQKALNRFRCAEESSCGAKGAAVDFDCPCGCGHRRCIPFKQALDGTMYCDNGWDREGTTLEDLTLHPSIEFIKNDRNGCGWHGHITRGHAIRCR